MDRLPVEQMPTFRPGEPTRPARRRQRPAHQPPVRRLTLLYDAGCPLCTHLRDWLLRQPQLVTIDPVPAASQEARRRYPDLDHGSTLKEITVIGDSGQIYRGTAAWIVCLWALSAHRPKAYWLATPAGAPFARVTVLAASKYRELTAAPCDGACEVPPPSH
ncbi:thiol-disulfide oxidoreductase DCC family protein [Streptomyces sp. NPDC088116]|uniref:thiol-disulfide oxidoreductase DCC family protein n=1 Tax=Streptomyces sp. NPDC088116 TaxID=3365825 RepID=UPI0037F9B73D